MVPFSIFTENGAENIVEDQTISELTCQQGRSVFDLDRGLWVASRCPLLSPAPPWTVVETKSGQWVFWNETTRGFSISLMQCVHFIFDVAVFCCFLPIKVVSTMQGKSACFVSVLIV